MIANLKSADNPDLADFPSARAQDSVPLDFVRPKKKRSLRLLKMLVGFGIIFALVTGIVAATAYYFLSKGPVASDRLRTEAESQLTQLLGENRSARIKEAKFAIGRNGLISIDARDVRILENDVTNLGVAGDVFLAVRAWPLLSGKFVAEKITLDDGQIAIGPFLNPAQNSATQSTQIEAQAKSDETTKPSSLPQPSQVDIEKLLNGLAQALGKVADVIEGGGLDAVIVNNTRIVDFSNLGLRSQSARLLNFTLERNVRFQEGLFFKALLETPRSNMSFSGQWRKLEDGGRIFTLDARGLDVNEFTSTSSAAYLSADAPLDFRISAPFSETGTPQQAIIQVQLGAGQLSLDKELKTRLTAAAFNLRLIPEKNQIELERSPFQFDNLQSELIGGIRFPLGNEDLDGKPIFEVIANDVLASAYSDKREPGRAAILVSGTLDNNWQTARAEKINVKMASGELNGKAVVEKTPKGTAMSLSLKTDNVSVEEFKQFWPPMIATGARTWAFGNLSGGSMRNAEVTLDFPAGALGEIGKSVSLTDKQLWANVPIVGSTVKTVGAIPAISKASATLKQVGMETFVEMDKGTAVLPSGRELTVSDGQLSLGDFSLESQPANIKMKLAGSAQAMAELGTKSPLQYSKTLGLSADQVKGKITGTVSVTTSLRKGGRFGSVDWRVNAKVDDFSSKEAIEGNRFSKANVTIKAQPGTAEVKGTADVNGIPATIAMVENFGKGAKNNKRSVTLSLNDAERKKLGIDAGEILTGRTDVSLSTSGGNTQSFDVDLRQAKLSLPWIGWTKGKGISATASFDLETKGKTNTLKNFRLRGKGFQANGTIVADGGGLVRAIMKGVKLNGTDDLDVDVKRVKGGYDVNLNARAYDGRAIIRSLMNESGSGGDTTGGLKVRVRGKVKKLLGFQKQTVTNLVLDYTQNKGRVQRADIKATASGNAATRLTIKPGDKGLLTSLEGRNAGSILRFLDIYSKVRGGTITVKLTSVGKGGQNGTIVANYFTLLDEPRLGQLLKPPGKVPDSRLDGERAVKTITKVDPRKVEVETVFARVEMRPKSLVVKKGRLKGGDAGAAFEGVVYDPNNRIDLRGTFLPAYGLNSFVSKIPLLGLAFGSGRSQGLVGITFRLKGAYKNPNLVVNPISILTPGVFRKLFEF